MKEYFCNVSTSGDYGNQIRIFLGYKEGERTFLIRDNKPVEVKDMEEYYPATLEVSIIQQAQFGILTKLIDELIRIGVKPTVKLPDSNELTVTKYHLEDMRRIVFKGLR